MVAQILTVLVLGLGLGLVVWFEKVKETEQERSHYLDLRKDSRLAQEQSLRRLQQEQYKRESNQPLQE